MTETYTTYYQSPLGWLQICSTEKYISKIHFVDEGAESGQDIFSTPLLQKCVEELIEYFNGKRLVFDVPVFQEGTDFQNRVWNELLNIHFGQTISYLTLAKRLGDPKCIRAAASTNGKNSIAIIVPCHRVIGINQTLVGYAGGLGRKKWLLAFEAKIAHGVHELF